jgi:membrane protease YdiL (CAAX protease family)
VSQLAARSITSWRLRWRSAYRPFAFAGALIANDFGVIGTGHVLVGDVIAAVLLLALLLAGSLPGKRADADEGPARALRALAIVALVPVLALGLPLRDASTAAATLLLAALLGGVFLAVAPVIGVRRRIAVTVIRPRVQVAVCVTGLGLGVLAYLAGAPRAWAPGTAAPRVAVAVVALIAGSIAEELVFRCLVQGALQRLGRVAGLLAAAALSTGIYAGSGPAPMIVTIAIAAIVFGAAVDRTGTAVGAIGGHVALALGAGVIGPLVIGTLHFPPWRGNTSTLALLLCLGVVITLLSGGLARTASWSDGRLD